MYRVSDLIKLEDIRQWVSKDIITITAGCGVGKSYFIKNVLYDFAKQNGDKILFLVHRSNCKNQFEEEIKSDNKADVIHIATYQSIESDILYLKELNLDDYKYIVADEYQYFHDDYFNKTTDISLNEILNSNAIKIFMSATDKLIKGYLKNKKKIEIKEYEIPVSFDHIRSLAFFNKEDTMFNLAKECIENNDKGIFFVQSAKLAYELYSNYKDNAVFNCSKSNKEYYKHVDEEVIGDILTNQRFEKNILITTCAMDAGVNIIDLDLNHIVCDVFDVNTMLQCMGRKRISAEGDGFHLYIKSNSNKQLGGIRTSTEKKIKKADFLLEFGAESYIKYYYRNTNDYSNIIYDEVIDGSLTKKVNELIYYKHKYTMLIIDEMIAKGDYGYNKYFADLLGIERYRVLEEEKEVNTLKDYLDGVIGQKLFKEEQQELCNLIIKELTTISKGVDYRSKSLKPSTIEVILREQLKLNYAVSGSKKESTGDNRGKRFIIITKIN